MPGRSVISGLPSFKRPLRALLHRGFYQVARRSGRVQIDACVLIPPPRRYFIRSIQAEIDSFRGIALRDKHEIPSALSIRLPPKLEIPSVLHPGALEMENRGGIRRG